MHRMTYEVAMYQAFHEDGSERFRFTAKRVNENPFEWEWKIEKFDQLDPTSSDGWVVLGGSEPHLLCATWPDARNAMDAFFTWWRTQNPAVPL